MTFLLTFILFTVAVAAMAVGVMLSGRKLASSCGGLSAMSGEESGDCGCARKAADLCGEDADHELVAMAEVGWPMKRPPQPHAHGGDSAPAGSIEV
ncbi:MAG: hypothetical protein O3A20_04125 [Planctomycetota bacterium]|nr:hypothetical protein [Planctomycetota bacterium]